MNARNTFIVFIFFLVLGLGAVLLVKTRFNFGGATGKTSEVIPSPYPTPAGDYQAVSSPNFVNFGEIPAQYTCDGENTSPPLTFSRVPKEAKSLALIVDDADAPGGSFVHWIVWNIPATTQRLERGVLPHGSIQGLTDYGANSYSGPCPPETPPDEQVRGHRYFFKLYALDTELDLRASKKKEDLEKAMTGHIIIQSQLVGTYARTGK